jgi:putative endonuclease
MNLHIVTPRTAATQQFRHDEAMNERRYSVYIMASRSHNLYIGVTNSIVRRVREHKNHTFDGFTARYNVDKLVWYETYPYIRTAIAREKQLKRWVREKKIQLIEEMNPTWQDLSAEWKKPILPLQTNRRSFDSSGERQAASAQDDKLEVDDC